MALWVNDLLCSVKAKLGLQQPHKVSTVAHICSTVRLLQDGRQAQEEALIALEPAGLV